MSDDRLNQLDYYELLRIETSTTADEVKRAFHQFALRYHPDRFAGAPEDKRERAAEIYRRGAEAYRVLTNPMQRVVYDKQLAQGQLRYAEPQEERPRMAGALEVKSIRARQPLQRALDAEKKGDLQAARLNYSLALQAEPDNAPLKEKLEQIVAKLKGLPASLQAKK